jgi:hypothetical protein
MNIGSRQAGLIALAVALIFCVGLAAISSVTPRTGFFAMTVSGLSAGDTTAVYRDTISVAPAIVYFDATNSIGYGVVADSRPAETALTYSELIWASQLGSASTTYLDMVSYNLRGNLAGGYRTYGGTFTSATAGTGSVNYSPVSTTLGGGLSFTDSLSTGHPAIIQGLAAAIKGDSTVPTETIVLFDGATSRRATNLVMNKVVDTATAVTVAHTVRVYVFTDSTGYISTFDTTIIRGATAGDSDLIVRSVPLETRTWTRVYVEGRRQSDSAPIFMARFQAFAAETHSNRYLPAVQTQTPLLGNGIDTMIIPANIISANYSVAAARMVNANVPHLLRADSNTNLTTVGESDAQSVYARIANTTMTIAIVDANGNQLNPTSDSIYYELRTAGLALNIRDTTSVRLGRYNPALMKWEAVPSTMDATGVLTASLGQQGIYALLVFPPATSPVNGSSGSACLIDASIGKTGLSGILPSLRSARDMVLGSAFGRLFVSGYYGFAAILMIAATGFGAYRLADRR